MNNFLKTIRVTIPVILLAVLCGCATQPVAVCTPPPPEKIEAAKVAREASVARLHAYQIGVTTEADFLRTGWRQVRVTQPSAEIRYVRAIAMVGNPKPKVVYTEYIMGYPDWVTGKDVEICTLHFDAAGLLQSVAWK
jgi:hypothetical protein